MTSKAWRGPRASSSPALPPSGVAVLNADDPPRSPRMATVSPCAVLRYGVEGAAADVRRGAHRPRCRPQAPAFAWRRLGATQRWSSSLARTPASPQCPWLPLPPRVGAASPLDGVVAALGSVLGVAPPHGSATPDLRAVLVVDCYNADQASTGSSSAVAWRPCRPTRKVALLGLMAELGTETEAEHQRVARLAEELGIEVVAYQTGLYGSTQVFSTDDAVALAPQARSRPTPRR